MNPKHYQYLIVGGGLTAHSACEGIRSMDPDGTIGILSSSAVAPYAPPPLTKALWKGDKEESIFCHTEELGVDLLLNHTVGSIDPQKRIATDQDGNSYQYDKLLLATGGTPRRLPVDCSDIIYFRTVEDYRRLRTQATAGTEIAVLGGGFIGSEIAAALAGQDCRVTLIFAEDAVGGRILPKELAAVVTKDYEAHGIRIMPGLTVRGVGRNHEKLELSLSNGDHAAANIVVAGLGITPQSGLAASCGLHCDNGIAVNEFAEAEGASGIYAAGDVALFPCLALKTTLRVEHEDHAIRHGKAAGMNMAGAGQRYDHLPFFYSDLFDNGYEAVGILDNTMPCMVDWHTPGKEATVYYLDTERHPRGILTWNSFGKVDQARELIAAGKSVDTARLE